MADMGVTEISATSQEIVSSIVQETLKQESVLLPTIKDYSAFAVKGSDEVKIPRRDQFSADDKTENTSLTAQAMTFSVDTISLSKHKAILSRLEKIASIQAMVNVEAELIKEMAKELALQVDEDIVTELQLASASAPDHRIQFDNNPTNTVTDEDILEARRLLNAQNVPQEDRFLVFGPDQEKAMLGIANFIEQDKYGPNQAIMKGELGMVRGFRVIMTNAVSASDECYFYHREAVGYASQQEPEFKRADDLPNVAEELLLSRIYGNSLPSNVVIH
jgi:N4-gp56 family major capsid protein